MEETDKENIKSNVENKKRKKEKKHQRKINHTNAISMTKDICIGLFLKGLIKPAIEAFDKIVEKTTEAVRPNRKNPRNKKPRRLYYMNYKDL